MPRAPCLMSMSYCQRASLATGILMHIADALYERVVDFVHTKCALQQLAVGLQLLTARSEAWSA